MHNDIFDMINVNDCIYCCGSIFTCGSPRVSLRVYWRFWYVEGKAHRRIEGNYADLLYDIPEQLVLLFLKKARRVMR